MQRGPSVRKVVYAFPISHRFRAPFHQELRKKLALKSVAYHYVFADNFENDSKGDTVKIDWADSRPIRRPFGKRYKALWHDFFDITKDADLIILQQESRFLSTYAAMFRARFGGPKVALFGHGRNFQARHSNSVAERWKRLWSKQVHWWFAYTNQCAGIVEGFGFDPARITVFNNSIDLSIIAEERALITTSELSDLRTSLVGGSTNIGVYVGGLYREKRLSFLIKAADEIRAKAPDFQLLVIGGGPESGLITDAAATRPWLKQLGPLFGIEKTRAVSLANVWLMPGLVGLSVLDSFAYDTPMVTTSLQYHSPEFEYLRDGVNGVVVQNSESAVDFANAVLRILKDDGWRAHLVDGGKASRELYSIDHMAERFAQGVLVALDAKT